MSTYKSALAIFASLLFVSCDQQPHSQIADADRHYFDDVRGIIHSLEARFEHIKALTGRAEPTNPSWSDALAKDADEIGRAHV